MVEKEGYVVGDIYQGGYSSLKSPKQSIQAGSLGLTTDPRTANVLQSFSSQLSTGIKNIEVEFVSPEMMDSIPKQQLKEVNRLSKLTGVGISVHGPVIDTTGITQQGFSELNREASERRIIDTLMRSHEMAPKENISVNFHTAEGIPGSQFTPGEIDKEGKRKAARLIIVNRESGQMTKLEPETKYYPDRQELKPGVEEKFAQGLIKKRDLQKHPEKYHKKVSLEKGTPYTAEKRLDILNKSEWDNALSQLFFNKERADEILEKNLPLIQHIEKEIGEGGRLKKETLEKFPELNQALSRYMAADEYLKDVHQHINEKFSQAYKYGNLEQRKKLKEISDNFGKTLEKNNSVYAQSKAMAELIHELKNPGLAPNMYMPIEEFATTQSSKTYGNAALAAYKKFGDNSPLFYIENPPAGFALSTGEDVANLVKASRKQFIEKATQPKDKGGLGMSKSSAKTQAEKLIGATWDVGHINMLRKYGYNEDEIIKETKKVAPYVKHVHLSDNFGFEHTELPMGMGNVPLSKIMAKLGEKGYKAKKIIEATQWYQHFKSPPVQETLEALGSPIYSAKMAPYWNQSYGLEQGYFGGYGLMLPQGNYQTFGAGFSQLPAELGGQMPGQGSRMSGRGME